MTKSQIVALGGSLLKNRDGHDLDDWFSGLISTCKRLQENGKRIGFVIGGGSPARYGINLAKNSVTEPHRLDLIGISATKLNATTIQQVLISNGIDVADSIPNTIEEAVILLRSHQFVCMGGTTPGHTTDTVATRLAIASGASSCTVATDVPFVYDKDPNKFDDAVALEQLNLSRLAEICGVGKEFIPGQSAVIDPIAVGEAISHSIDMNVLDGKRIELIESALFGREFEGSRVTVE